MNDTPRQPPSPNDPSHSPGDAEPRAANSAGQRPPLPQRAPYRPEQATAGDGRPVSFYLAIFLALLLFISGGLNLLLLFFGAIGSATSNLTGLADSSDANFELVSVGGDRDASDRLLVIPIQGAIAEAQSPVIGAVGGTVSQVQRALRVAGADATIRGVLLDINSPGGGVTDSDEIWRMIGEFRAEHKKPVLALFGDIAASGGYYIAAACDAIWCRPTTITGSIGVIMQNFNVAEAADKLGIGVEVIISERTPHKDILSMFRPMGDDERAILMSIVNELYDRFVTIVDDGRPNLDRARVIELADGRVYSANQAVEVGLVDRIGTEDEAVAHLLELCDIGSAQLVEQRRRPGLSDLLFGARAAAGPTDFEQVAASLLGGSSGPRFLYYWAGAR